jgi:hypothetical protein
MTARHWTLKQQPVRRQHRFFLPGAFHLPEPSITFAPGTEYLEQYSQTATQRPDNPQCRPILSTTRSSQSQRIMSSL